MYMCVCVGGEFQGSNFLLFWKKIIKHDELQMYMTRIPEYKSIESTGRAAKSGLMFIDQIRPTSNVPDRL
jgi:hypothetical protein